MAYLAVYLVKFNKKRDAQTISAWLEKHKHSKVDSYPKVGFVAYHKDAPIAAGFLRKVEGGYGQIDGFVTNPDASSAHRHLALEALTKQLLVIAKQLNMTQVIAITKNKSIYKRGLEHDFKPMDDYALVAIKLK